MPNRVVRIRYGAGIHEKLLDGDLKVAVDVDRWGGGCVPALHLVCGVGQCDVADLAK